MWLIVAIVIAVVVAAAAAAGGAAIYFRTRAPNTISLSAFTPVANLSDDCDQIRMSSVQGSSAGPGSAAIALQLAGRVEWFKAIELFVEGASRTTIITASGLNALSAHHLIVAPHELATAQLVFYKAKFLGSHSPVYQVNGLSSLANQTVTFTWEQDDCRI